MTHCWSREQSSTGNLLLRHKINKRKQKRRMRRREEKIAEINVADGISLFVLTYKNKDFRLWRHTRAESVHQPSHNVQTETFLVKWCRQIIVLNCWCCFSRFTAFVSKGEKKTNLNQQLNHFYIRSVFSSDVFTFLLSIRSSVLFFWYGIEMSMWWLDCMT